MTLTFTNDSSTSCTLMGYPGVAGVDAHGHQIEQAKRAASGYLAGSNASVTTVDLAPHGRASAVVEGTNNPSGTAKTCSKLTGLDVTAPGTRQSHRVALALGACSGLSVHPVVQG